jgi:[acyl-carrier-protein] S-malonyltransferase
MALTAILFPGQGSQTPEMRDTVADVRPELLTMAVEVQLGLRAMELPMPVRWRETMLALRDRGAERLMEVGPGKVLTGLVKRTLRDVELIHG